MIKILFQKDLGAGFLHLAKPPGPQRRIGPLILNRVSIWTVRTGAVGFTTRTGAVRKTTFKDLVLVRILTSDAGSSGTPEVVT